MQRQETVKPTYTRMDTNACIDPHVHCMDFNQAYKSTIESVTGLARSEGVVAFFDMPNCDPDLTSEKNIQERIEKARSVGCLKGYYVWAGVTPQYDQIRQVVGVVKTNPHVIGLKMYAGSSTGNLGIIAEKDQRFVYQTLAQAKYRGVLAVHCEKESLFKMDKWDPSVPSTWNKARPPEAEKESIKDQIRFAKDARFKGILHVAHISLPEGVDYVNAERNGGEIRVTCGVTPHHLSHYDLEMEGREGLLMKVNPPLRDKLDMSFLSTKLHAGLIDWIETDHAPHTRDEKLGIDPNHPKYPSGITSLNGFSGFVKSLYEKMPAERVRAATYFNIKRTFPKVKE